MLAVGGSRAQADQDVRVGLFQKELPDQLKIRAAGGLRVIDLTENEQDLILPGGEALTLAKSGDSVHLQGAELDTDRPRVRLEPLIPGTPMRVATDAMPERAYSGVMEVEARPRELLAINIVPEEEYLESVVADEMPAGWPMEALKAQAVVSRTYLRKNRNRHRADRYDFCDLAHCQVYEGRRHASNRVRDALRATDGQVLAYHGELIEALFHSCCGGVTASNDTIWAGRARAYLPLRSDAAAGRAYCADSPDFHWTFRASKRDVGKALADVLGRSPDTGAFQTLAIHSTDSNGRVDLLQAGWDGGTSRVPAYDLYLHWGRRNGWHQIKSTWFTLRDEGPDLVFDGRGLGHGVGLCQWGARGRALAGQRYEEILAHYFPGTRLGAEPPPTHPGWLRYFFSDRR